MAKTTKIFYDHPYAQVECYRYTYGRPQYLADCDAYSMAEFMGKLGPANHETIRVLEIGSGPMSVYRDKVLEYRNILYTYEDVDYVNADFDPVPENSIKLDLLHPNTLCAPFDIIFAPYQTMYCLVDAQKGYINNVDVMQTALRTCLSYLKPNGLFIMESLSAATIRAYRSSVGRTISRIRLDANSVYRRDYGVDRCRVQYCTMDNTLNSSVDGYVKIFMKPHVQICFTHPFQELVVTPTTVQALATDVGFKLHSTYTAIDYDSLDSWETIKTTKHVDASDWMVFWA